MGLGAVFGGLGAVGAVAGLFGHQGNGAANGFRNQETGEIGAEGV